MAEELQEQLEQVHALLEQDYHCSQVMMGLSMELRQITAPFVLRALGALGYGMFAQRTCGILTGGVCMLSSYFPREEVEPEPMGYQKLAERLVCWFEETYHSIQCGDLVGQAQNCARCPQMMAETFVQCLALLEEEGIDPYE